MKRICLILIVLFGVCVLLSPVGCQERPSNAEESKSELKASAPGVSEAESEGDKAPLEAEPLPKAEKLGPRIKFKSIVCELGRIGPGTNNVCEFEFTNIGDELLVIKEVTKTCGCTPFTLDKKEYAPGESGTLKVRYKAPGRPLSVSKTLYVYSNDKTNSKVKLAVKATVVNKVECEPKALELMLNKGNAGCPAITLRSIDKKAFSIVGFKASEDCITADYDASAKKQEFVLHPKVNIGRLRIAQNGQIEISLTHPECEKITISFTLLPRFKVEPRSITVYKAKPREAAIKEIWVTNNYNEGFEVGSTSSKNGFIKVLKKEMIDSRCKFELEIMPPAADRNKRIFSDTFFVNIKGGERLQIACRGFYVKEGEESTEASKEQPGI
jgi:hypothetical protein